MRLTLSLLVTIVVADRRLDVLRLPLDKFLLRFLLTGCSHSADCVRSLGKLLPNYVARQQQQEKEQEKEQQQQL